MTELPEFLESGELARLIPTVADTSKEQRAASVFLAALMAVREFSRAMLGSVNQRVGKRAKIECFTEVVFKKRPSTIKHRPDGIILVTVGKKQWSALFEAKIGRAELNAEQLYDYIQLARLNNIQSVITTSNQFVALPDHHPVFLPKSATRTVGVFHWSWMYILTQALLLEADGEIEHEDQRYLLSEVIRFLSHGSAGISSFDRMNKEWKDVVQIVQSGGALKKSSTEVENTVASWHQEQRDLCLIMSRELGRDVSIKLSKVHKQDPQKRLKDDCRSFVENLQLECELEVPDAAAPLKIAADLRTRRVLCSMKVRAPDDRVKTSARVNWLLRHLDRTNSDGIYIQATWPGKAPATNKPLVTLREYPTALQGDNPRLSPTAFEVILNADLAGRFAGTRTFIENLEVLVPKFYEEVGQYLRAWVPSPPKPKERSEISTTPTMSPTGEAPHDQPIQK
jgi:hypothetical protein